MPVLNNAAMLNKPNFPLSLSTYPIGLAYIRDVELRQNLLWPYISNIVTFLRICSSLCNLFMFRTGPNLSIRGRSGSVHDNIFLICLHLVKHHSPSATINFGHDMQDGTLP